MKKELFAWDGWDEHDTMDFSFYSCKMIKDFGPLKKGEEYDTIYISYEKGIIEATDDEGKTLHKVKFTLTPVES